MKDYVAKIDNVYRVADTHVSLDSIVYEFRRGASPESIQRSFSTLTLEEVYGAIAFYLANQTEVEKSLAEGEKEFENLQNKSRAEHQTWYNRLQKAREEIFVS